MIELAQHIEALLLENDCVIIPNLGGFIAHYAPAVRIENEHLFLPPTRNIGFNPQLRLNDGVLVQSYMVLHDTNFSDATKIVEKEVDELIAILHEEGKISLNNIGEVLYTIHGTYKFVPYDNKITTPYLYGLDTFEMEELSALQQNKKELIAPIITEEKKAYEIRINRTFLRSAAAMVAAVALFFFLSAPVENTYVEKGNYAQLLPTDLFEKIENQSMAITPVNIKQKKPATAKRKIVVKEAKVAHAPETAQPKVEPAVRAKQAEGDFHIIVAAGIGMKEAEKLAEQLRDKGFANAKALNCDGKIRVSIMSYTTSEEATRQMLQLRKNEAYQNAWMLAR